MPGCLGIRTRSEPSPRSDSRRSNPPERTPRSSPSFGAGVPGEGLRTRRRDGRSLRSRCVSRRSNPPERTLRSSPSFVARVPGEGFEPRSDCSLRSHPDLPGARFARAGPPGSHPTPGAFQRVARRRSRRCEKVPGEGFEREANPRRARVRVVRIPPERTPRSSRPFVAGVPGEGLRTTFGPLAGARGPTCPALAKLAPDLRVLIRPRAPFHESLADARDGVRRCPGRDSNAKRTLAALGFASFESLPSALHAPHVRSSRECPGRDSNPRPPHVPGEPRRAPNGVPPTLGFPMSAAL